MKKIQLLIIYFICIISGSVYADLSDGLITYFPFNGNAHDESGNGNNGIVHGAELTTDRHGNLMSAYLFASEKKSWIEASADGLPTTERTVSLWFYAINVNMSTLLGYGGNTCGTSWLMLINVDDGEDDAYQVQSHCRVNQIFSVYSQPPIGQWYHWVITTDSNGTNMYIDGSKISEHNKFINNTFVEGKDLAIGVIPGPDGIAPFTDENGTYFSGMIDDIRIYNRSLSTAEAQELYELEKPNDNVDLNKGLVAYYPFDGDAIDHSGNNNNGTIEGATFTSDINNKVNSAIYFDGIDDYVNVPHSDSLSITKTVTIAAWVKAENDGTHCILEKGGDWTRGTTNYGFFLQSPTDTRFVFTFEGGTKRAKRPNDSEWHHYAVVATHQETDCRLYFDGKRIPISSTNGSKRIDLHTSNKDLHIGSQIDSRYVYYGHSSIDELRIYNRGLSDSEISSIYYGNSCNYTDADNDGVIDQWDKCPNTPLNSYVNRNGCPLFDNSAVSGRVLLKGHPLNKGTATLIQSGELFQKSPLDNNGCFKFDRVAEQKSINIMIRKPVE